MGGISGLISLLCMVAVSAVNIGDTAPALEGAQWLKGNAPVFKNRITVVEIWRTTCGNCKAQMPHLTALQKKYGDTISIAALSKEPVDVIAEFIKANGDQMGFTVGKISKELSDSYMTGVKGVPYAFLINRDGAVVWKGHPADIDNILARAVDGSIAVEELKKIALLEESLKEAMETNDPDIIAPADQNLLLADPGNEEALEVGIRIALYNDEPAKIKEMFDRVPMEGLSDKKASSFAMMLVSESNLAFRYPEAALKFSLHALKQNPQNDYSMDVYARVLYCLGEIENAILWEKKALALNPDEKDYQSNLDYYMAISSVRGKIDYKSVFQLKDLKAAK